MNRGKYSTGLATVEFALFLPLLILLLLGVFDLARAIQAQLILVNMAREGASISSRASLQFTNPQTIMNTITSTSPPLDMPGRGMIYITKVMGNSENCDRNGNNCTIRNVVLEQYRWVQGWNQSGYGPSSPVWNCGSSGTSFASDGHCNNIPSSANSAPTANVMYDPLDPNKSVLANGDVIYVVDVFYRFNVIFGGMTLGRGITTPNIGPDLHVLTVL